MILYTKSLTLLYYCSQTNHYLKLNRRLSSPVEWCELNSLHLNIKSHTASKIYNNCSLARSKLKYCNVMHAIRIMPVILINSKSFIVIMNSQSYKLNRVHLQMELVIRNFNTKEIVRNSDLIRIDRDANRKLTHHAHNQPLNITWTNFNKVRLQIFKSASRNIFRKIVNSSFMCFMTFIITSFNKRLK